MIYDCLVILGLGIEMLLFDILWVVMLRNDGALASMSHLLA